MKIAIAGTGYVGLSIAVLLSQNHEVYAVDIMKEKVEMINHGISPLRDKELEEYLGHHNLHLTATTDGDSVYKDADMVVISTPTNYDPEKNHFDTSSVESVMEQVLRVNPEAYMVIKSTVPVGYTLQVQKKYATDRILFSPEFLREGRALYDNLYPSRIIVGAREDVPGTYAAAQRFVGLLKEGAVKEDIEAVIMEPTEAEAVKLFANTYLAMRVSYFNELDSYAENYGLDSGKIIHGMCLDPRIGDYYNNPSFGYGGYCLPKDTKQLLANFAEVPNEMMGAIVRANDTRMDFIADHIRKRLEEPGDEKKSKKISGDSPEGSHRRKTVGIYRLTMKTDSDNFRQSAIQGVMARLKDPDIEIVVYEPTITADEYAGCRVVHDLGEFKKSSNIIVSNRKSSDLSDVAEKVYTRDLYTVD
ncbi:MAG: nucleotide sugar dehydrogenase [Lachnospiraceae bacterium]|nr:nucleotide sugar dehydrogenase [Butyrivibrio sp.]MCM1343390.1 nucleotide sugar dehydrogenase [Muribaculaceae bacterium]MCM1410559.1 nucleotide sugar dehydrogenase [Lachnospiraceae bacterium]